jgi:hypothetical protein
MEYEDYGGRIMWWYFIKMIENEHTVIYSYGRETKKTTGEFIYDKSNKKWSMAKLADGDNARWASWAQSHCMDLVKGEFPTTKMIAIG